MRGFDQDSALVQYGLRHQGVVVLLSHLACLGVAAAVAEVVAVAVAVAVAVKPAAAVAMVWAGSRCSLRWKRSYHLRVQMLAQHLAVRSVVNVPACRQM